MSETDPILDLDALLDPARLAAAWQVARDRSPAAAAAGATAEDRGSNGPGPEIDAPEADAPEADAPEADAPEADAPGHHASDEGVPARPAPLPVAVAHRQLLDELEHTLAAPGLTASARRILSAPLAQLAQATEPLDLAAAETALDQLEDVLAALLSEAGWPQSPQSPQSSKSDED
jgi:hypothetical protein